MTRDRATGAGRSAPLADGVRLALGTLTVFPVPPPRTVDRRSGGWAMTLAPLVGLLLAVAATGLLWLLGWGVRGGEAWLYEALGTLLRPAAPLLAAALTIGLLAALTRGLHLDGLADTADGLGSGRPADQALAVMRRSDIGPFGVVVLVLALVVQVVALGQLLGSGRGTFAVVLALVVSRLMLPAVCLRGIPAARRDGLGQAVAGSVSRVQLLVAAGGSALLIGLAATVAPGPPLPAVDTLLRGALAAVLALLAGAAMCGWSVRRLGGITGDVMGACVEVTFTVALVVLTLV